MSDDAAPLVPAPRPDLRDRTVRWLLGAGIRLSLLVSPRPAALLIRRVFAAGGASFAAILERHAPAGMEVLSDERYGVGPDALLDIVHPPGNDKPLPVVVWIHGGGWVGGSKDELRGYLKLIAIRGYVVVAPRYSLAPEHLYPTPLRQVMAVLAHVQANAERYGADPSRIVIAGDSAGAQLTAQTAALVTTPGYAATVGVTPTLAPAQLRGVVLACGPFDLGLASHASSEAGRRLIEVVLWAYSGKRHALEDPAFASWSVTDNLTPAFPPALITVGNSDPLRAHSELLAERLAALGVETETQFFAPDHRPPLGHEYQFDLDSEPGQAFLERLLAFLDRRLGAA